MVVDLKTQFENILQKLGTLKIIARVSAKYDQILLFHVCCSAYIITCILRYFWFLTTFCPFSTVKTLSPGEKLVSP